MTESQFCQFCFLETDQTPHNCWEEAKARLATLTYAAEDVLKFGTVFDEYMRNPDSLAEDVARSAQALTDSLHKLRAAMGSAAAAEMCERYNRANALADSMLAVDQNQDETRVSYLGEVVNAAFARWKDYATKKDSWAWPQSRKKAGLLVLGLLFCLGTPPGKCDMPELRPFIRVPVSVPGIYDSPGATVADANGKNYAIEGLTKVTHSTRLHWYSVKGQNMYHYKLKGAEKEAVLAQKLKTVPDLREKGKYHGLITNTLGIAITTLISIKGSK